MARSVWKGPFVDGYLLKKAEASRSSGRHEMIRIWSAALDHPAAVRRAHLRRLQRPEAHPGDRHRGDGRPQVRRVRADALVLRPFLRPQGQACLRLVAAGASSAAPGAAPASRRRRHIVRREQRAMSKKARERSLSDTEAKAVARMLRVSPQKLNLRGAAHPRQEGRDRARRSRILAQAHRPRRAQVPGIRHRQRREQPRSRRRRSRGGAGLCRQGAGAQAQHAARPRPRRTHIQAVLEPHHRGA